MTGSNDVTLLLARVRDGDSQAIADLFPHVYERLRAMAGSYFQQQSSNHTLQPTALVHEAYLKLVESPNMEWQDRAHFAAVAATAMRQILTDRARKKRTTKHGGDARRVSVARLETPSHDTSVDVVGLDDVLSRLAKVDERQARIVELRFFGGMTVEEVAHVMDMSRSTIEAEWRHARAWLGRELSPGDTT